MGTARASSSSACSRCSIALCFAEVGSRFDRTGGPYLPARVAYGRFIGFEVGWMMWFTRVASQASVVNGLALALAFYWPSLRPPAPRAMVHHRAHGWC